MNVEALLDFRSQSVGKVAKGQKLKVADDLGKKWIELKLVKQIKRKTK